MGGVVPAFLEIETLVPELFQRKWVVPAFLEVGTLVPEFFKRNRMVPVVLEIETLFPEFFKKIGRFPWFPIVLEIETLVPEFFKTNLVGSGVFQTKMGGARVFRNWNAGSGAFQTKSGKVPVVLEMCQLVPDVFGNVRQVSVFSRCFSSWSAGSGRFRKVSEGFHVIPLFSKLVSWFRKISGTNRKVSTFPRYRQVGLRFFTTHCSCAGRSSREAMDATTG